jgi:hypothetical protein
MNDHGLLGLYFTEAKAREQALKIFGYTDPNSYTLFEQTIE